MIEVIAGYQVNYGKNPDGSINVLSAHHASTGLQCSYGAKFSSYDEMEKAIRNGIWAAGSNR